MLVLYVQDLEEASRHGEEALRQLAQHMVNKARELSLDTTRDSPFALLAKENDILWGGGMPDDTTVIVARIFRDNEGKKLA
jgi:protein phosphatase PTC7